MSSPQKTVSGSDPSAAQARYHRFLLIVAGLGGLLYGVDVGIIAGALPYLEATSGLTSQQLSSIVAAVLLGSVISTLFAGALADLLGRKKIMVASGVLFVASIPIIALAPGYGALLCGRLLQGLSAGLIGVVVPLYLAECLDARSRGRGTAIFQWLLTAGIVVAAAIGMYFSIRVGTVEQSGDAAAVRAIKDHAWRAIFWASLPPGVLFALGCLLVTDSPRWLHRRGHREAARAALLRSRSAAQAELELEEMAALAVAEKRRDASAGESLLRRKYLVPFVLACVILACNQTTGVNSIIGYNATILLQGGLTDVQAHWGYLTLTLVNFLATIGGVVLIDRRGRKFLLTLGTAGIVVSLTLVGLLFRQTETRRVDVAAALQAELAAQHTTKVTLDHATADRLLAASERGFAGRTSLVVIYAYGDFRASTKALRSDDTAGASVDLSRESCVPRNRIEAWFGSPRADFAAAQTAPLRIEHALITPVPSERHGWLIALAVFAFMAFFAVGPGVCVWLALSELMPTRIRSNGMSIALFINQAVSTSIAGVFLPTVGRYGYATMFFGFAACTVVYFVTAAFFLPETKGQTLEEIETHFSRVPEPVADSVA